MVAIIVIIFLYSSILASLLLKLKSSRLKRDFAFYHLIGFYASALSFSFASFLVNISLLCFCSIQHNYSRLEKNSMKMRKKRWRDVEKKPTTLIFQSVERAIRRVQAIIPDFYSVVLKKKRERAIARGSKSEK